MFDNSSRVLWNVQQFFGHVIDASFYPNKRVEHSLKLSAKSIAWTFMQIMCNVNRPFPSYIVPLFPNKSKCETFHTKMSSACSFIFMQIKLIFIRMVSHLDSL